MRSWNLQHCLHNRWTYFSWQITFKSQCTWPGRFYLEAVQMSIFTCFFLNPMFQQYFNRVKLFVVCFRSLLLFLSAGKMQTHVREHLCAWAFMGSFHSRLKGRFFSLSDWFFLDCCKKIAFKPLLALVLTPDMIMRRNHSRQSLSFLLRDQKRCHGPPSNNAASYRVRLHLTTLKHMTHGTWQNMHYIAQSSVSACRSSRSSNRPRTTCRCHHLKVNMWHPPPLPTCCPFPHNNRVLCDYATDNRNQNR